MPCDCWHASSAVPVCLDIPTGAASINQSVPPVFWPFVVPLSLGNDDVTSVASASASVRVPGLGEAPYLSSVGGSAHKRPFLSPPACHVMPRTRVALRVEC